MDPYQAQLIFLVTAATTLTYFLFSRRVFDAFSVLYFGCLVYFIPAFTGYIQKFTNYGSMVIGEMFYETYLVDALIIAVISLAAATYDWFPISQRRQNDSVASRGSVTTFYALKLSTYLSVGLSGIYILLTPEMLTVVDRTKLVGEFGLIHTLWTTFSAFAFVLSSYCRKYYWSVLPGVLILFDLIWLGNREIFACVIIALSILELSRVGASRLVEHLGKGKYFIMSGAFIFIIKHTYIYIKLGDIEQLIMTLSSPYFYFRAFALSEPAVNQAILDKVLLTDFSVPLSSIDEAPLLLTPAHRSLFDVSFTSFRDIYQPQLFPFVEKGMANNIWAQMISLGGYKMLAAFLVALMVVVAIVSTAIRRSNSVFVKTMLAIYTFYLCFLINRSDLSFLLSRTRIVLTVGLLLFVLTLIARAVYRSRLPRAAA
jgi:hypothetical protein